ncbi:MAG: leucine-rich repeat protein, partial [Ruminiclostridium sp.]|nr:leucine-rich repeat protein [Ruminiclostridium sp.]
CTSLTSVQLPDGLTRIGGFSGCTALTSVNIPNSVTTIEGNAFSGCTSLTSIEIPNSVEEIYANAFSGCTYLASIDIPNNVTYIGNEVFSNCSSLKSINVNEKNANYSSLDGVLFNKDKTKLIKYPEGKEDKSYSIPNDVTEIANAFRNCIFLTSVRLPSGLKIIGSVMEFDGCSSLQSIEVDEKNENYTSIDGVLFYKDKTRLVLYPAAKENESYSIPNGVVWIDYAAFNRCSNLVSVVIPSSVETIIFHRGFYRCTSLKSIIVDENNKDYSSVDGVLFTKNKGALLQYPLGKTDTSYSIPDSVKYIGDEAFCGCTYLNSVEIPNNVENIFINAFSNCTSLVSVIIYSDKITSFGESYISSWIYEREVFDNCPALTVYGYENSYVQGYMNKYNIPFKIIGKEALIDPESYIMIENPNLENLTLEAKKSADSTDFRMIYNITLKDEAGKEVQPAGEVTVKLPLPEGWKDAAVSRRESNNALTDMNAVCENGYAVFVTDHFSEYVLALKPDTQLGDLNSDKTTNAIDAKWVLQYVSGSRALTPAQKAAADVNSDGTVNAVDAKWILQSVSGSRVLG